MQQPYSVVVFALPDKVLAGLHLIRIPDGLLKSQRPGQREFTCGESTRWWIAARQVQGSRDAVSAAVKLCRVTIDRYCRWLGCRVFIFFRFSLEVTASVDMNSGPLQCAPAMSPVN